MAKWRTFESFIICSELQCKFSSATPFICCALKMMLSSDLQSISEAAVNCAVTGLKCFPWIQLNPLLNHSVDGPVKWLLDDGISQHLLFTLSRSHISLTLLIPSNVFQDYSALRSSRFQFFFKLISSSVLSRSSVLRNRPTIVVKVGNCSLNCFQI